MSARKFGRFIEAQRTRDGAYDLRMEILVSCPLDPRRARIQDLCEDLLIRSQTKMVAVIRSMMPDIPIQLVFTETHGYETFILRSDWAAARSIGQEYWNHTYGH